MSEENPPESFETRATRVLNVVMIMLVGGLIVGTGLYFAAEALAAWQAGDGWYDVAAPLSVSFVGVAVFFWPIRSLWREVLKKRSEASARKR